MKYTKLVLTGYLPKRKCGASDIISGISTGLSGILGFANLDSQYDANAANIQMQRETNRQNYNMFHEQQDYAERMWNEANQYNSPAAQVQRLREAGINPYAMLGSNGQGSMGSAGLVSSPSPTPMQAPQVRPVDYSPSVEALQSSIDSYFENANQDAEADIKKVDLAYRAIEKRQELRNKQAELEESLSRKNLNQAQRDKIQKEKDKLDAELSLFETVFDSQVKKWHLDNLVADQEYKLKQQEVRKQELDNKMQELLNEGFPQLSAAQIKLLSGQAASAFASAGLSKQMTKTEVYKTIGELLSNGIRANEFTLQQLGMSKAELDALLNGEVLRHTKDERFTRILKVLSRSLDMDIPGLPIRLGR